MVLAKAGGRTPRVSCPSACWRLLRLAASAGNEKLMSNATQPAHLAQNQRRPAQNRRVACIKMISAWIAPIGPRHFDKHPWYTPLLQDILPASDASLHAQ